MSDAFPIRCFAFFFSWIWYSYKRFKSFSSGVCAYVRVCMCACERVCVSDPLFCFFFLWIWYSYKRFGSFSFFYVRVCVRECVSVCVRVCLSVCGQNNNITLSYFFRVCVVCILCYLCGRWCVCFCFDIIVCECWPYTYLSAFDLLFYTILSFGGAWACVRVRVCACASVYITLI